MKTDVDIAAEVIPRPIAEMAEGLRRDLDAGDIVLVKGSNYMRLGRLVDAIRKLGQAAVATED